MDEVRGVRRWLDLIVGVLAVVTLIAPVVGYAAQPLVIEGRATGGFVLAADGRVSTIYYDPADAKVVAHAAQMLASDLAAVTGVKPEVVAGAPKSGAGAIILGTLGHSRPIDRLVARGKLKVAELRGAWESFVITPVDDALVIVGGDRRGTAYGAFELSEAMGVSPWTWWADVAPARKTELTVPPGARRFGPPSVRYRGIFINDEDWGLFPWAARTYDPAQGNIGPKTYERVFELLLRLKANTLWPAMHKTSAAFNSDPDNARLADEYGIVMGSSHAEPMLRNNVGEWTAPADQFNYAINPQGVGAYWEERARSNGSYESLWTLGMRGIHDSGIVGAKTTPERVALLDKIIADQRALLRQHVDPTLARAPQMFVPYKEVLDIYRGGLTVPDDVTIVWPDDNFGYIRQFPSDAERKRGGGAGVYYHLSYLGAPLAYLWLSTTPPALIQTEMTRAYDQGARTLWIANVGDIKPAEIGTSLFMEMAWDIDRWRGKSQREFLNDWSGRTFGRDGAAVGGVLEDYYRLNFELRPEFLQTTGLDERIRANGGAPWIDGRLKRFADLVTAADGLRAKVRPELSDAFFELVDYPVRASAAANRRFFAAERYRQLIDSDPTMARSAGAVAVAADDEIKALTRRFNEEIAGGKWRWIMSEEPADGQWRSFRTPLVVLPTRGLVSDPEVFLTKIADASTTPPSGIFEAEAGRASAGWTSIGGLGRGGGSLVASAAGDGLAMTLDVPGGAARQLELGLLPLFPNAGDTALGLDVAVDGGAPRRISIPRITGDKAWSAGVLDNLLRVDAGVALTPGSHEVVVTARSSGVAIDRLMLSPPAAVGH